MKQCSKCLLPQPASASYTYFSFFLLGEKEIRCVQCKGKYKEKVIPCDGEEERLLFFFFKASVFFVRTLHIFSDGYGVLRLGLSTGFSSSMLLALVFDHIVK